MGYEGIDSSLSVDFMRVAELGGLCPKYGPHHTLGPKSGVLSARCKMGCILSWESLGDPWIHFTFGVWNPLLVLKASQRKALSPAQPKVSAVAAASAALAAPGLRRRSRKAKSVSTLGW